MESSTKKDILLSLIFIVCGFLIGFLVHLYFAKPKVVTETITIYDSSVEQAKIDSLNNIVQAKEQRIVALKDSVKVVKTVVVKEVEKIRDLPLQENVELLKSNLVAHGEFTAPEDTLPKTVVTPQNDTLVLVSEGNVKDANEIVAKYEGEIKINEKLEEALGEAESISIQKDSVIAFKDTIIESQEEIYSENLGIMEKNLKKEKTKGTVLASIFGAIAAVLGVIAIAK